MSEQSDPPPDDADFRSDPSRVLTLTDGVVGIAMTLLALDLKPDPAEGETLGHYLRDNVGSYAAFLLAFVLVAQFWVVHHRTLRDVETHDLAFTWANMLFLFGITLLPVTTSMIGGSPGPLSTTLYAADLIVISGALGLLRRIVDTRSLLHTPYTPEQRRRATVRTITTTTIPVLVIAAVWVIGSKANYLFFLFAWQEVPGQLVERRAAKRRAVSPR